MSAARPVDVLAAHAAVIQVARAGGIDVLRPEAVAACVVALADALDAAVRTAPSASAPPPPAREFVLAHIEAAARGFCNARVFRRWCRARNVPLHRTGKRVWVRAADVDVAMAGLATAREPANTDGMDSTGRAAVDAAVAAIVGKRAG